MKLQLAGILLFISGLVTGNSKIYFTIFNKSDFYSAMASQNIGAINNELAVVQNASIANKDAYEGTLLMTKAGLIKKIPDKISLFKAGRIKLERCIINDTNNAELRFLRLIVQENVPAIVNYKGDLEKDKTVILQSFKTLSPEVQKYIRDYSKGSKILHPKNF